MPQHLQVPDLLNGIHWKKSILHGHSRAVQQIKRGKYYAFRGGCQIDSANAVMDVK